MFNFLQCAYKIFADCKCCLLKCAFDEWLLGPILMIFDWIWTIIQVFCLSGVQGSHNHSHVHQPSHTLAHHTHHYQGQWGRGGLTANQGINCGKCLYFLCCCRIHALSPFICFSFLLPILSPSHFYVLPLPLSFCSSLFIVVLAVWGIVSVAAFVAALVFARIAVKRLQHASDFVMHNCSSLWFPFIGSLHKAWSNCVPCLSVADIAPSQQLGGTGLLSVWVNHCVREEEAVSNSWICTYNLCQLGSTTQVGDDQYEGHAMDQHGCRKKKEQRLPCVPPVQS